MPLHLAAWRKTSREFGFTCDAQWLYERGGVPSRKIVAMLAQQQGLDLDAEAVACRKDGALRGNHRSKARPFPAMVEFGRAAMVGIRWRSAPALCAATVIILQQSGLGQYIPTVVAADDVAAQTGARDLPAGGSVAGCGAQTR